MTHDPGGRKPAWQVTRRAWLLGLVLGDYTIPAIWSLIGVIYGIPTYQVFH